VRRQIVCQVKGLAFFDRFYLSVCFFSKFVSRFGLFCRVLAFFEKINLASLRIIYAVCVLCAGCA